MPEGLPLKLPPAGICDVQGLAPQAASDGRSLEHRVALEGLYRSHCSKVAGYFRTCGINEAIARELAQETFVLALRGLSDFKGESKLSTWVWSIARNVMLGHVRSGKVGDVDMQAELVDPDTLISPNDGRVKPEHDCVRRGFAAFSRAHPARAEVVYLAVVEGWTREELAAHLGRTVAAATEYLVQCKARLRPFIEGCDEP
jgi:RNA polymerase sigma-70 factor (ECF subfamily)